MSNGQHAQKIVCSTASKLFIYLSAMRVRVLRQAINHRKKSIENYTDECIRPVYMVSVHTSSV